MRRRSEVVNASLKAASEPSNQRKVAGNERWKPNSQGSGDQKKVCEVLYSEEGYFSKESGSKGYRSHAHQSRNGLDVPHAIADLLCYFKVLNVAQGIEWNSLGGLGRGLRRIILSRNTAESYIVLDLLLKLLTSTWAFRIRVYFMSTSAV